MKLSLDALRLRAEAVASDQLLETISGGTNNDCHDTPVAAAPAPATLAPVAPSTPVKWEIGAGASIPVGGQPTFTGTVKVTF